MFSFILEISFSFHIFLSKSNRALVFWYQLSSAVNKKHNITLLYSAPSPGELRLKRSRLGVVLAPARARAKEAAAKIWGSTKLKPCFFVFFPQNKDYLLALCKSSWCQEDLDQILWDRLIDSFYSLILSGSSSSWVWKPQAQKNKQLPIDRTHVQCIKKTLVKIKHQKKTVVRVLVIDASKRLCKPLCSNILLCMNHGPYKSAQSCNQQVSKPWRFKVNLKDPQSMKPTNPGHICPHSWIFHQSKALAGTLQQPLRLLLTHQSGSRSAIWTPQLYGRLPRHGKFWKGNTVMRFVHKYIMQQCISWNWDSMVYMLII